MPAEGKVVEAYRIFLDMATEAPSALRAARPDLDALDEADAEAFLAGLIEGAMQFVITDPRRPAFVPWVTPTRRWMDNGADSVYWMAPVDGQHRYRIAGQRGEECYLSFTLYAGDPGHPETVAANYNHRDLGAEPGAGYILDLEPPPDACYVLSRQYFTDPAADRRPGFDIEVLDGSGPEWGAPDLASRWAAAASFLRAMTSPAAAGRTPPAYVSTVPNVMGDPAAWSEREGGGGRGTPDQTYALGPYRLDDEEALVMDVTFPRCVYASAAVWNRFSQTVDRRFHRSTINHAEAVRAPSGSARLVVAHRDPGVPNWLDTGGRTRGSVFWRFLLAEELPGSIGCNVVAVDEVASLPAP